MLGCLNDQVPVHPPPLVNGRGNVSGGWVAVPIRVDGAPLLLAEALADYPILDAVQIIDRENEALGRQEEARGEVVVVSIVYINKHYYLYTLILVPVRCAIGCSKTER